MKERKRNRTALFFIVALVLILAGMITAVIRTGNYNRKDRMTTVNGSELFQPVDYSAVTAEIRKEPGGWDGVIEDGMQETYDAPNYDAYTMTLDITNTSDESVPEYDVRVNVQTRVYFLTGWCGTLEFHQYTGSQNEKCQTIDLRNRPDEYTVDIYQMGGDALIPLFPGDYFIYHPSVSDGEAPLSAGGTAAPGIMYYERKDTPAEFEFVPAAAPEKNKADGDISLSVSTRSNTWTKIIDPEDLGLTEPNYQAYTYDVTVTNQTSERLDAYEPTFRVDVPMYLSSAWNGAMEIEQTADGITRTAHIKDLRSYDPAAVDLKTILADGEALIPLNPGDSFRYCPSEDAMEVPLSGGGSATSGMIVYLGLDDSIESCSVDVEYHLHRNVTADLLFRAALILLMIWVVCGIIVVAVSIQTRAFRARQEHDAKIILESIEIFTGFIDAKDPYTNGHSRRVAAYTRLIAERLGFTGEELDRIFYVALLHDCGKIGVPDQILCKPGSLTEEEFDVIKSHTVKGGEILRNFSSIPGVGEGALFHHERYDGKGYPEGRSGEDIPQIARMICVADSFDAMNSDRCYRRKLTREVIIDEITRNSGAQFDPKIAAIMLQLIEEGKIII